jgi:predicted nucleotidyltransferase
MNPDLHHIISRLKPQLELKWGVVKIGYFDCYLAHHHDIDCEVNIIVELEKPLGWEFFALKEWLELKLAMRIDICTSNALKPALRKEILENTHYV